MNTIEEQQIGAAREQRELRNKPQDNKESWEERFEEFVNHPKAHGGWSEYPDMVPPLKDFIRNELRTQAEAIIEEINFKDTYTLPDGNTVTVDMTEAKDHLRKKYLK